MALELRALLPITKILLSFTLGRKERDVFFGYIVRSLTGKSYTNFIIPFVIPKKYTREN